jgi:hypothetical protein
VLSGHIRARAQALGLPVPREEEVRDSFARQAGLWWTYLLEGEGGRWQERSRVYVANAMAGRPERERLAQVFAGTELADLERGYLAWAHRTRLALQPWWPCPPEAIDKLFVQRQLGSARLPAPVPGQVGAALAHEDAELRHALALAVVRRGDLARAMAILEPLAEREDDFGLRIKSEIERVRALAALRDTFLGGLARDGGRLKFERGERAMNAKVVRVEPEHVVVTTARGGEELVPIAELRSFDLVRQIGRQADAEGTDWVRAYPYVLEGDERWESMLREPGEPGLRLRADAKAWYPALLGLCSAAETVNALETEPAPQDAASAAATMKAIESLLATHAAHPAVRKRRAALRSLATTCFNLSHADEDPCAGLHAKVARAEDGRVRLLYEFDDAAELEDFHSGPGYPKGHVASVPPLETNGAAWKPRGGSLRGAGDASWRHVLPFEGPILVRLRLSIDGASRGGRGSCMWIVGACDDGLGSYYAVRDLGSVYAADISSGSQAMDQVDGIGKHLSTDVTYALDLDFDGERLSSVMNGVTVKELSTKVRTSGDVFLTVNSDALILIESLEIVGTPSVAARRTRRLGERLAELGLLDD